MLKKWLIVLAIPLMFQLGFLGLLLKNQIDNAKSQKWAIHTKDVIEQALAVNQALVTARANMLGLAISGKLAANPFDSVVGKIATQIRTLRDLVKDSEMQPARIDRLDLLIQSYLSWIKTTHEMLLAEGRHDEAVARIRTLGGKRSLDAIQREMAVFLATENRLDLMRQETLRSTSAWLLRLIVVGSLVTIGSSVMLGVVFSLGLARRIDALAENARRLADGKTLIATVGGADEIGQLSATFEQMANALRERDQENEMFIYSVSHDLRSPLVNLQGFSRELAYTADDLRTALAPLPKTPEVAARLTRLLESDMPDSIHFIQNGVSRLSAIIDSLLRLSRAGRVEYQMQALDMERILAHVVESQAITTSEKGASISVGPLPSSWGDPTIIEQVFANLISNAVKYLDPSRTGRIEVFAEPSGGDMPGLQIYAVRDNGLGIAEAHQMKLFRAFQRLHPGVAQGEGIGLALVRRMVERHGGKIWAKSEAGVGSTFFVGLPTSEGHLGAESSPRRSGPHQGARL